MNKIGFIVNGRKSIVRSFSRSFDKCSKLIEGEYNVLMTSEQGHAQALAKELANDSFTHVISVGGDGTLHEVVNGVMQSDRADCVVGLLPYGTANDYAKSIVATKNLADLIDRLNCQKVKQVNLGRVTLANGANRHFINIADMGLGVEVVQRVNRSQKWLSPGLTFSKAILQSFMTYKNQQVTVKAKDWEWHGKINSFVIANGKYFGSGMCIAPDASPEGDTFSVVIIGDVSIRDYIRYIGQIKKGKKIDHPEVLYKTAKSLQIESSFGIEADGEFIGLEPTKIEILKRELNFLSN